jgi:hypothetical protein
MGVLNGLPKLGFKLTSTFKGMNNTKNIKLRIFWTME